MLQHCGTELTETLFLTNGEWEHEVQLIRARDRAEFCVLTELSDMLWCWIFNMDGMSIYEEVKHLIIDTAYECQDMQKLTEVLDDIFKHEYADSVVHVNEFCCDECEQTNDKIEKE